VNQLLGSTRLSITKGISICPALYAQLTAERPYTLQFTMGRLFPPKLPLLMVPWATRLHNQMASRHLDRFSRFSQGSWLWQTDRQQATPTYSAWKLFTHFYVPQRVEGWVNLATAGSMRSRQIYELLLYITMAVVLDTSAHGLSPWALILASNGQHATTRPLQPAEERVVNNLPKVVTRQHSGQESNSQPSSC